MLRIIGGSARGLALRVPRGLRVRPTGARVRTSLFSILAERLPNARVLDLFAGCGALGLEALSRGAGHCCFVETSREALAALADNLARSRLADRAEVLRQDAFTAVAAIEPLGPFDLALLDPPYEALLGAPRHFLSLLEELALSRALAPAALAIVQHDTRTFLPERIGPLVASDRRVYGTTALTFLDLLPPATDP